jgi:uncharacterized membrane protein
MKAKSITDVGIVAALYAVFVVIFAPISFSQFQFRVAELLKPIVIKRKHAIIGIGLGNLVGNLVGGAYAGVMELTLMPITCIVWGWVCWYVGNRNGKLMPYVGSILYALGTTLSVAFMLSYMFGLPFLVLFLYVGIAEIILLVIGTPLMGRISEILEKKNL